MNAGARHGAPLTRAQRFQWHLEKGLAVASWALPAEATEESAERLAAHLTATFHVLRTSVETLDGELRQVVHARGPVLARVNRPQAVSLPDCAGELAEQFRVHRLGREGLVLAESTLLTWSGGQALVLVADNAAVDAGLHVLLDAEVEHFLRGDPDAVRNLPRDAWTQPREFAEWESGPDGLVERAGARHLLRQHLAKAPPRLHPRGRVPGPAGRRYYRATLNVPGAHVLFRDLVDRTRLLPSALVLAAFTGLSCWRHEVDGCTVNVSVENRHRRAFQSVAGPMAQRVPLAFPFDEAEPFLSAGRRHQAALAAGHPLHGRYDPDDLVAERRSAQLARGVALTPDLAYNFMSPPQGWGQVMRSAGDRVEASPEIDVVWTSETDYEYAASLSVRWVDAHSCRVSVHGDEQALASRECADLLRGLLALLQGAASGEDVDVVGVAHALGLQRHGRRTDVGQGRHTLDVRVVEEVLAQVDGVERATVTHHPAPDAAGLPVVSVLLHAAAGRVPDVGQVPARLLEALEAGELLVLPRVDVVVAPPPAEC